MSIGYRPINRGLCLTIFERHDQNNKLKRHPSLIPLSRFHRSVLFLALVCKKNAPDVRGYPTENPGKRDYAISFYQTQLKAHMDMEEQKLFPAVAGKSKELADLVKELKKEHLEIERCIQTLARSENLGFDLDALGVLLESHIRKEERQFFQLIQKELSEQEINALSKQLTMDTPA